MLHFWKGGGRSELLGWTKLQSSSLILAITCHRLISNRNPTYCAAHSNFFGPTNDSLSSVQLIAEDAGDFLYVILVYHFCDTLNVT